MVTDTWIQKWAKCICHVKETIVFGGNDKISAYKWRLKFWKIYFWHMRVSQYLKFTLFYVVIHKPEKSLNNDNII